MEVKMKPKKIMIVDDEPAIAQTVKFILAAEGYDVSTALSGDECLEKLKKEPTDLVLLDVMMPKMTGWQVFEEIRKKHKDVQVAYLTVIRYSETVKDRMFKDGLADLINKPFDNDDLINRVEKILTTPRA